jgi:hypothetical protein
MLLVLVSVSPEGPIALEEEHRIMYGRQRKEENNNIIPAWECNVQEASLRVISVLL